MTIEWNKNKPVLIIGGVLLVLCGLAWKYDFSFQKLRDKNYTPGQMNNPPPPQPPQAQPWVPPIPKVSEEAWRNQYEKQREQ